jgi:hypothetical protein
VAAADGPTSPNPQDTSGEINENEKFKNLKITNLQLNIN